MHGDKRRSRTDVTAVADKQTIQRELHGHGKYFLILENNCTFREKPRRS